MNKTTAMQQLVCQTTGRTEIVTGQQPKIGRDEMLVQMRACGICGTDVMKVYDERVAKPVQLGHELVASVAVCGEDVRGWAIGQRVAIAHHAPDYSSHYSRRGSAPMDELFKRSNIDPGGFAQFIRIPALLLQHTVLPIPEEMPDLRAVFIEPLACCLRALDRIHLLEGDSALVIGVGAVGILFLPLLRDRSVVVLAVDVRAERLALAQQWGAVAGALAGGDDVVGLAQRHSQGRGADAVIVTALTSSNLALALDAVRDGGAILLFGARPDLSFPLNWWNVWRREINIISSYSATPDLLPRALALLRRSDYALEQTVSHTLPLSAAPSGFDLVHHGQVSKVVICGE
jgi:L-iditol 2-dehydrogenase